MRTRSRKRIWNRPSRAHRRKLWCHPCQHRSLPRKDLSTGRRNGWLPPRRQFSQQSSTETMHRSSGRWREAFGRIAVAGADFRRTCPRRPGRVDPASCASGRAPGIRESFSEAEGLSSGGHRVDSSRVVSVDGISSGRRAGSPPPREHSQVIELSSMLTKGAERMVEMIRPDISDDEFRSRAAPGEGWFAPY